MKRASTKSDDSSMVAKTFDVLFHKRKHNKVHKSKGVSKMDGRLIVMPPPICLVKLELVDAEPQMEGLEEAENDAIKKSNNACLYSATNKDLAKRVFGELGLHLDDFVVLSQFECQITGIPPETGADQATKKYKTLTRGRFVPLHSQRPLVRKLGIVVQSNLIPSVESLERPRASPGQNQALLDSETEHNENVAPMPRLVKKRPVHPLLAKKRALDPSKTPTGKSTIITTTFPDASGMINIPNSILKVLRPHQVSGVTFLWNVLTGASSELQAAASSAHVDNVRGCILADEPGIGKTLQSIAVLCAFHRRNKDDRFIVVCPSSLVVNWAMEFDKWIGRASSPKRVVVKKGGDEGVQQLRAFLTIKPNRSEVLIISFDLFRVNASLLQSAKQIGLLVVDEGHRLKNSAGSQTLSALTSLACDARLLITGTPIQNRLSEFHAVASFVCPGLLGDLASFRKVYERPINAANTKSASWEQKNKGRAQSQALDSITKTFMLRRLQKDVLMSMLPPRMEFLLFCKPSSLQCDMYKVMTNNASLGRLSQDALVILTNLRKLCSHPGLLDEAASTHTFLSGKLMVLDSLLNAIRNDSPEDKIVIVSNFTSALTIIHDSILKPRKFSFKRLDGTVPLPDRQPLVDSFNRSTPDQCFAFLLSSKAGGCGLNLIGANRLVMFDADFNPATDHQAMARIYRPGQKKSCYVYRLFTAGTVEEVIYQRQQQKGNLATITVNGASCTQQSAGFTKEELKDCFTLKEGCDCETKIKIGNRWPSYTGAAALEEQGCVDQSLLTIAHNESETLRHVHIVTDTPAFDMAKEDNLAAISFDTESDQGGEFNDSDNEPDEWPLCASEEEFEFDD